jgi:hypothetical protein
VLEKAAVLGGQEGLDETRGDLDEGHGPPSFGAEFRHEGPIGAEDPHGLLEPDLPQGIGPWQIGQGGGDQDAGPQQPHRGQVEAEGGQGGEHEAEPRQGPAPTPGPAHADPPVFSLCGCQSSFLLPEPAGLKGTRFYTMPGTSGGFLASIEP